MAEGGIKMWIITITLHESSKLHANILIKIWNNKSSIYANILKNKLNKYILTTTWFYKGKKFHDGYTYTSINHSKKKFSPLVTDYTNPRWSLNLQEFYGTSKKENVPTYWITVIKSLYDNLKNLYHVHDAINFKTH